MWNEELLDEEPMRTSFPKVLEQGNGVSFAFGKTRGEVTNPNPKVRKSGAVGKAVLVSMVLAGPIRVARETRGLRRRFGEFASEVFYFDVVKAGLSTEVRFCAILAVFLLCCYHQEPPIRKSSVA